MKKKGQPAGTDKVANATCLTSSDRRKIMPSIFISLFSPSAWKRRRQEKRIAAMIDTYIDPQKLKELVEKEEAQGGIASGQNVKNREPIQPPQHNAGSRPSSDDLSASETPSSLGPRG
jgi:hypothetical protein